MKQRQTARQGGLALHGLVMAAVLALAACAAGPQGAAPGMQGPQAEGFPPGWQHLALRPGKPLTRYDWLGEQAPQSAVIHARADHSASMLLRDGRGVDLGRTPLLRWQWKLGQLPEGARHDQGAREDAAARIVLLFDGDKSTLPLDERMTLSMAEAVSGRPMPYATLMYVVSASAVPDQLIPNPHTSRVQKIVAGRAAAALGQWVQLERDVAADYQRAFGEPPGRLLAYGVMTDADNTASQAEAWYAGLQFLGR